MDDLTPAQEDQLLEEYRDRYYTLKGLNAPLRANDTIYS
jgi:hypothetical protein